MFLQSTPFSAVTGGGPLARDLHLLHCSLRFAGPLFEALLTALEGSSASTADLARRPELSGFGAPAIRDALLRVILGDQIWPMLSPVAPRPAPSAAARYRIPLAYNRMLAEEMWANEPIVLASPVAGAGVRLSMIHAVCLRMLTDCAPADRAAWLHDFVARHAMTLQGGAQSITDPGEQQALIWREFTAFCGGRLAELVRLGVLEEAAN
jgi:hypothetical protein